MMQIAFADKMVNYDTFLNDVATRVVSLMKNDHDDPETISQRKAYQMFGRGNVDRWLRKGKVHAFKRPGKLEYLTAELRLMQRIEQDYL